MDIAAKNGAVASADPLAVKIGADILSRGGNAIDAAVATMLAECVVQPQNTGIGGYGGAMVIYFARERRAVSIDFNSVAPMAAREDMFELERPAPEDPFISLPPVKGQSNIFGPLAVSVPANVAGLAWALAKYGTLSWAEVSQGAIELAENGFAVYPDLGAALVRFAESTDDVSRRALLRDGPVPNVGDVFVQQDLAALLRKLADEGPAAFYGDEIAGRICRQVRSMGGILDEEDFKDYIPRECDPLAVEVGDYTLCTPGLVAGGLTALQVVLAMHEFGPSSEDRDSGRYHHALIELTKLAWLDRVSKLGDPLFAHDPTSELLSRAHISDMVSRVREELTSAGPAVAMSPEGHTVHTVAVDADRNMVSLTATQGGHFGSRVCVEGMGLVLGHGMSRFDAAPGRPNSIAPGKRMLHNMSPMLLMRGGEGVCVFGLPGGRRIPNIASQMAIGFVEFGMSPWEAIDAPRIHTEGFEPVQVQSKLSSRALAFLESRGHSLDVTEKAMGGPASAIMLDAQRDCAVAASQRGAEAVATLA